MIIPAFDNDWSRVLEREWDEPYVQHLLDNVSRQYRQETVYPKQEAIFNAFRYTAYADTKAVILGQDPYHGPRSGTTGSQFLGASGREEAAFAAGYAEGARRTIFGCDYAGPWLPDPLGEAGRAAPEHGSDRRRRAAGVASGLGWERFTDGVIAEMNKRERPVVFVLWGKHAQAKESLIDTGRHFVIASPHPSPLSARRGFFGSRPYSKSMPACGRWAQKSIGPFLRSRSWKRQPAADDKR